MEPTEVPLLFSFLDLVYFLAILYSMWGLSSPTRGWTHAPCIEEWSLNHWMARGLPMPLLWSYLQPKRTSWGLPGRPVVKTPCFQCSGCGFDLWSWNWGPTWSRGSSLQKIRMPSWLSRPSSQVTLSIFWTTFPLWIYIFIFPWQLSSLDYHRLYVGHLTVAVNPAEQRPCLICLSSPVPCTVPGT